jgi:hypothetical protein
MQPACFRSSLCLFVVLGMCLGVPYVRGTDKAVQLAKLTASNGVSADILGLSLATDGNIVFAGAPNHQVGANVEQGAVYAYVKSSTGWKDMTQVGTLIPSDGAAYDLFGISLAMSGNTVVVGARRDGGGLNCKPGKAYVFVKSGRGWQSLKQVAELSASDGMKCDAFGGAVSISGSTIVVGAFESIVNGVNTGAAYVFVEPSGGWKDMTETAKLTASNTSASSYLGTSVSTDGNTVIAGAPQAAFVGQAYVYVRPASGWTSMMETARLTSSDGAPSDLFGNAVSLSGNTVLVGSPGHPSGQQYGAAYVYVEPQSGWANMTETAELTASNSQPFDSFGTAVLLSGGTALIGAPSVSYPSSNWPPGSAYIFRKPASGWKSTSSFDAELTSADGFSGDNFGEAVALGGNAAMVGAIFVHWDPSFEHPGPGAVYVFGK